MQRVRLIHWNAAEAKERAARLRAAGYHVAADVPSGPTLLRELQENPPAAVVIDLSRLPAQGRDVGVALRVSRAARQMPLVFVGGDPAKVARVKELLPDATYTTWDRIRTSLKRAIARPATEPVPLRSKFAAYAATPLIKKLGIRADAVVGLVGAPDGFQKTLGRLPDGAVVRNQARGQCELLLWFTTSRKDLERRVRQMGALAGRDGLWILWPKASSGLGSDLTQTVVRKIGLAAGLVDYKIAAIDATWSGLRFTRKRG